MAPVLKIVTVWAAVGITSWSEAAAFFATIYTSLLISEWLWKKIVKTMLIRFGWLKADK